MSEEHSSETRASSGEAWREVGRRFESLGKSLAEAVRTAWGDESTQQAVSELESGLRSLARSVADAVDEAAASPEGQKVRTEAERLAASARDATAEATAEARPHVIAALETIRRSVQSAIDELERARTDRSGVQAPSAAEVQPEEPDVEI